VQDRFPKAHFTYIVAAELERFLPAEADRINAADIKVSPFRVLRKVRASKYDATVLMLTGQPIFQKVKFWTLFTNYRVLVVWNENLDYFSCCKANRRAPIAHVKWRLREKGIPSFASGILSILLSPLGLVYLLLFTAWTKLRSKARVD